MANKTPTKTSFSKKNQPINGRGKSERTKILEAMEWKGNTESGFYDLLIERAFGPDDSFTWKELLVRMSPIPKSVSPMVKFKFDEDGDPHKQAAQILKAMAIGALPSDTGSLFISSIQSMLKIQEITDIDERLKAMESRIEQD